MDVFWPHCRHHTLLTAVEYNLLKSKWSADVESAKSTQQTAQLTAADAAAIAIIRNNVAWIHG